MSGFNLAEFLNRHRKEIIDEWVHRLHTEVGEQYAGRPEAELYETVSKAFDANYYVLVENRYDLIHAFINRITHMRLEAGFPLSHVQQAFELYRIITVPLVARETTIDEFLDVSLKINACLAVTIHRFSDYFQEMHQRRNVDYARRLEAEVRDRTAKLKESESRYKTLVEEIHDGYFVIQDMNIVFANQAFCAMHGYSMDEVIGRPFSSFLAPESREKVIGVYRDGDGHQLTPRIIEYNRLTRNGRSIPTEFTSKATEYQNRPSHIGLCRDISERLKLERRMREAERMADIGLITTSLSHEIRNPLSAVQLNLEILKNNLHLTGNDGRRLDIAVREVTRLEGILKDLLDFAKPPLLDLAPHLFPEIVESCLELMELEFQQRNLAVVRHFDPDLPKLLVDRGKISQAVINLLLNAMDASSPGDRITLNCRMREYGGRTGLEASVADRGPGVPPETAWDIFKPFFTTKNKGSGLGLTNVRRIIEAHHGWVRVTNGDPQGAVFRIWLPKGNGYG